MPSIERKTKLTDRVVKSAKPAVTRYVLWDTAKPGFGLRVDPSGHTSFIVRYRANGGGRNAPKRYISIKGKPGEVLTADAARKEANRILADVAHGKDPAADRDKKRGEMTVSELCDHYMKDGTAHKKASTLEIDRGRIARHIKPLIGNRRISEVNPADIKRLLRDVAQGKTAATVKTKERGKAVVTGGKATANRVVNLLGGIFTFAIAEHRLTANPVAGIERFDEGKRERFLSAEELMNLGDALRSLEAKGTNKAAVAIIKLLTFTGARKSEIAGLQWKEVDIQRSCLRLGDSKTGAKVIHLGPPAMAILAELQPLRESPYVFPAESGDGHFQGTEKIWRKVRNMAQLPDVRIHDLRHSFASIGLAAGDSLPLIGKLLGHADVKTTARYAHLADDPVKNAASHIAETIAAAMDGRPELDAVPLTKTR